MKMGEKARREYNPSPMSERPSSVRKPARIIRIALPHPVVTVDLIVAGNPNLASMKRHRNNVEINSKLWRKRVLFDILITIS